MLDCIDSLRATISGPLGGSCNITYRLADSCVAEGGAVVGRPRRSGAPECMTQPANAPPGAGAGAGVQLDFPSRQACNGTVSLPFPPTFEYNKYSNY
jgi:hypothetical protein